VLRFRLDRADDTTACRLRTRLSLVFVDFLVAVHLSEVLPLCWILMGLSEPHSWSECVCVRTHVSRCAFSSMRFFTSPGRGWNFAYLQVRRDAWVSATDIRSAEPAGLAGDTSAFFLPTVLSWRHAESAGFCVLWDQHQISAQVLEWELWVRHCVLYDDKMSYNAFAYIVQDSARCS